jgi:transposase
MEAAMQQYVGLDVSQKFTHVCAVDSGGKVLWQGKCASTPEAIAQTIKAHAADVIRIGLESGPLCVWHWHALKAMALPVVCLDARHAKAALSMQLNKTDKNDAHSIAQIVRTGWYREVSVKSLGSHALRSLLQNRYQLVCMRVGIGNQIRGTLKTFGIVLPLRTGGIPFDKLVESYLAGGRQQLYDTAVRSLLAVYRSIKEQTGKLDRELASLARKTPVVRLLMTIPGVGALTALAFVATIDDPKKFAKSRNVGAYLGLTPRRYQSGEIDHDTSISRCGDTLLRTYLFEAANVLMTRIHKWTALKAWGIRLAKRGGMKKAKIAVARKLAVTMHAMWLTGEFFRWSAEPEPAAA